MRFLLRAVCFFLCVTLLALPHSAAYAGLNEPDIGAAAALVVDMDSGEVLFDKNSGERRAIASLTKLMTCMLVLESGNLDDLIIVGAEAFYDIIASGSTAGLMEGEEIYLRDLVYCMMLPSANEACNIAAGYIAGDIRSFIAAMNERAAALGCLNTRFDNTHGLPNENHYSTAYDMYLIARAAADNPLLMEICNTVSYTLPATNLHPEPREIRNSNGLINPEKTEYYYPYAAGMKTGSTDLAGFCLISTARQNGLRLMSVVLGASREKDTSLLRSFIETRSLYEWAFASFSRRDIVTTAYIAAKVNVTGSVLNSYVLLVPKNSLTALLPNNLTLEDLDSQITLYHTAGISAPVTEGETLGELSLSYNGQNYGKVMLVAAFSIAADERAAEDGSEPPSAESEAGENGGSGRRGADFWIYAVAAASGLLGVILLTSSLIGKKRR